MSRIIDNGVKFIRAGAVTAAELAIILTQAAETIKQSLNTIAELGFTVELLATRPFYIELSRQRRNC